MVERCLSEERGGGGVRPKKRTAVWGRLLIVRTADDLIHGRGGTAESFKRTA